MRLSKVCWATFRLLSMAMVFPPCYAAFEAMTLAQCASCKLCNSLWLKSGSGRCKRCEPVSPWGRVRPLALCHPSGLPGGANGEEGGGGAPGREHNGHSLSRASESQQQQERSSFWILDLQGSQAGHSIFTAFHTRALVHRETLLPILSPARHQEDPSPGTNSLEFL